MKEISILLKPFLRLTDRQLVSGGDLKQKAKRRERRTGKWELIGHSFSYGVREEAHPQEAPEWLKEGWNKVRGTTKTLCRKWRLRHGMKNPQADYDNWATEYFRNGKRFRYMIMD